MISNTASVKKTAVNFGILLALLSIALQMIAFTLDSLLDRPWWLTFGQFLITIGVLVYGIRSFKVDNNRLLKLGDAIKVGLAISLIAGLIGVVFNYFFMTYIDPEFAEKSLRLARENMEQNPQLTPEQVEMSMKFTEKMMSPWIISALSIIWTLFVGFIVSLIAGLAMRTHTPYQNH